MIELAKTYMPPAICLIAALLIIAGVPADVLVVPFLVAEAIAMVGYIHVVSDRLKRFDVDHHPSRRWDDDGDE